MKTILLAASAALLASTAPAFAQDAAAPAPASAANFTGGRVEIFGGWDHLSRKDRIAGASDRTHTNSNGVTAGVLLGYDLPVGDHFIVGPFASYALSSAKECVGGVGCVKSDRQIEGGARAGVKLLDGRALAYVKGAYVNGQFRAHGVTGVGTPDEEYFRGHANRDGWRAGAGVQYALTRHAYVKAEYDYTKFSSFDASQFTGVNATNIRFDRQEVLGGFGVQF
ncbi:MAG TPA: outer membrane beta-barrel protein [Sphingomonas sp.]